MATLDITNIDLGGVILEDPSFDDETVTFAGADTFAAGTILARDTVSGKLVLYAVGGSTNGNGVPCAVLTYQLVRAGAGDLPARVLVGGKVKRQRLVVDAAGNDSTITQAVKDLLRARGIIAVETKQLSKLDNQ